MLKILYIKLIAHSIIKNIYKQVLTQGYWKT